MGTDPTPPAPKRAPRMRRPAAATGQGGGRWPMMLCVSCNVEFRSCDLPQHQPDCRGPDPANRTCKYCAKLFESV